MKAKNSVIYLLFIIMTALSINAQSIKLMTYNIRLNLDSDRENSWKNRKDYFTSQIRFYEPDIFGVQEATPIQVSDIVTALSQYDYIGIGREGVGKGESSNIYYIKDRFKVVQESTFWLSETPDKISKGWDAACNRVCTYSLFKDLKNGKKFWVFNTHLDHMGELARTKGIELILSKIKAVNTRMYPVVFMGDFNSQPTTDRIIALKKVMQDCRSISQEKPFGPSGTFNDFKHNVPVTDLIDYVFMSKNSMFKVRKFAVLSDSKDLRYPSDHLPVYVEIRYN